MRNIPKHTSSTQCRLKSIEPMLAPERNTGIAVQAAAVIEELTIDAPRHDEVLVGMAAIGVCHRNTVMDDRHSPVAQPVVLGHKGAGVARVVGSPINLAVHDHVALSFDSCDHCASCRDDAPPYRHAWFPLNFGASRSDESAALIDADGHGVHSHVFGQLSFSSHAIVHRRNVVKVDRRLPLKVLGSLGCGIRPVRPRCSTHWPSGSAAT